MIANRKEKLAMIHVAKKACGMDDEQYRALLAGTAGVESAADIENEKQYEAVMDAFRKYGFVPKAKPRPKWTDTWGCTPAQRARIEGLWRSIARNKSDEALAAFVKRIARVDSPRFLVPFTASKVIVALERMADKPGEKKDADRADVS